MPLPPVVLVTGCAEGGLGHSLCVEFARRKCHVYATGLATKQFEGLRGVPGVAGLLTLDVTRPDQVHAVVQQASSFFL